METQLVTSIAGVSSAIDQNVGEQSGLRLAGTLTMIDTNRDLIVLQDDTGAVALHLDLTNLPVKAGSVVTVEAEGFAPYLESQPEFPFHPSRSEVRSMLEAPVNWGDYNLTRVRGFIHPLISGDYTFWIASDNSSELWLSPSENPVQANRIAEIKTGDWVDFQQWDRYPSQHSDPIHLRAGQSYYIEADQEQSLLNEHLSVAWQPPGAARKIIGPDNLTPWVSDPRDQAAQPTNGILFEYWTNFTMGALSGVTGKRPYKSMLTLKNGIVTALGTNSWPNPMTIRASETLDLEANYRWVELAGIAEFIGNDGQIAKMQIVDDQNEVQVVICQSKLLKAKIFNGQRVKAQGVCEGLVTATGQLIPGVVWVPSADFVSVDNKTKDEMKPGAGQQPPQVPLANSDINQSWNSYASFRGIVTFNDQVMGWDRLFIQNDTSVIFVSPSKLPVKKLQLGTWVEIGGIQKSGRYHTDLNPIILTILGNRSTPSPAIVSLGDLTHANQDGNWIEVEGIIHSVDTNGTMELVGKDGSLCVWVGNMPSDQLRRYVNTVLRLRGVYSIESQDHPVLLVPSNLFIDVQEDAPDDPFDLPLSETSDLAELNKAPIPSQRVKIRGTVTYHNGQELFVQDQNGGARIELSDVRGIKPGTEMEIVGFPSASDEAPTLTKALARQVTPASGHPAGVTPVNLNQDDNQSGLGLLVRLRATLLSQRNTDSGQILELQQGQQFYTASLSSDNGHLPIYDSGSRLEILGVRNFDTTSVTGGVKTATGNSMEMGEILLRSPDDVAVIGGPPWWTWKGFLIVVGILMTIVFGSLLTIYLLRRRLAQQQLAKLHFSRQILKSQEEERHRIATNLHDSLGQNLLAIKTQSRPAKIILDENLLRQRLDQIADVASQAIDEVRQITQNLRPYQLDRLGLTQSIRAVVKQVSENSVVQFASNIEDIDGLLEKDAEIHVYRIVQESITNIIKHAEATEATVVLKRQPKSIVISVRDNGRGFDLAHYEYSGLGISSMTERVGILGGSSRVQSRPGGGTILNFEIPVEANAHEKQTNPADRG